MTLQQANQVYKRLNGESRLTPLERQALRQAAQVIRTHKKPLRNPRSEKAVLIYSDALRVYAKKGQKHRCDPGCVKNGHRYYHPFKAGAAIYGLSNGDILIRSKTGKRLWGMF